MICDPDYDDTGKLQEYNSDYWASSPDKVYQGAAEDLRVTHPIRTPARRVLAFTEVRADQDILSDQKTVKNIFGRMKSLFAVLSHNYRRNEVLYDHIFRNCVSPTNCHIMVRTVLECDGQHFMGVCNCVRALSASEAQDPRLSHERASERRRVQMKNSEACTLFEDSD